MTAQYEKVAATDQPTGPPPAYEVVSRPAVVAVAPTAVVRRRLHVTRACFCMSTKTATGVMAALDLAQGFWALVVAGLVLAVRTHEHKVDQGVVDFFAHVPANATEPHFMLFHANMTASETAVAVASLNDRINFFAPRGIAALLVLAAIAIFFGTVGLKAKTDLRAARTYACWKLANAFFALCSFSLGHALFSGYCALVARSHFLTLAEEDLAPALPTVVQVQVVPPQPAKTLN